MIIENKGVMYGRIKLHLALASNWTRRKPKRPLYLTERLFCALRSVTLSHNVHEREIQMVKMTKVTTMERNYVKGTWNILIVNVNLNTVSISSPRRKVQHSCTLSTYLNSQFQLQKNAKKKKIKKK